MNEAIFSLLKRHRWTLLTIAIAGTGIVYRIVLWQMNRGLFIDEANLARNIFERDWLQLLQPLSYEQYAPPVFLWLQKAFTQSFGYSEKAFRLYPLLSGIAGVMLLAQLLRMCLPQQVRWYPLVLFATGAIYLRYATECKQYMPDALVSMALLWLALKTDIRKILPFHFAVIWILAGSLAIWSSMPSVFILAGIGCYYAVQLWHTDIPFRRWAVLITTGSIWLLQFAAYYLAILSTQIKSGYLQNFHQWYFLDVIPAGWSGFTHHNWLVIKGLTEQMGGKLAVSLVVNLLLTMAGLLYAIRKRDARIILLAVPGLLLLIASMMKSYSLVERLVLFYFPYWLIIIGFGLQAFYEQSPKWLYRIVLAGIVFTAVKANKISYLTTHPLTLENVPVCLDFLVEHGITKDHLYISHLAEGGYVYYTQMHPEKERWASLRGAQLLQWNTSWDTLFSKADTTTGWLFTSLGNDIQPVLQTAEKYLTISRRSEESDAKAYILAPK